MFGSQLIQLKSHKNQTLNSDCENNQFQENLERLSNIMVQKTQPVRTIYVQLHGYLKSPSMHQTPQTRASPTSKQKSSGYFEKQIDKNSGIYNITQRKSLHNLSSEQLNNSNFNKTEKHRTYNSWVGLSVIERNQIFIEQKQKKLKMMRDQKDVEEISQCTFVPSFFNPIKSERPKSFQVNRSYQDIHQLKKLHNSRIY